MRALLSVCFAIAVAGLVPAAANVAEPKLVDQTGRVFTLASLRGAPVAVTFISAHCTDACPLVNAQFSDAARQLQRRHIDARLVTITLDPQHDPPSSMRALASTFGANPRYWLLASGQPSQIEPILHAFGVVAKPGPSGYREQHSTFVYVFDARGNLAKTMLASTNLSGDVVDAIRALPAPVQR